MRTLLRFSGTLLCCGLLSGCLVTSAVGTVVGAAVKTTTTVVDTVTPDFD